MLGAISNLFSFFYTPCIQLIQERLIVLQKSKIQITKYKIQEKLRNITHMSGF